MKFIILFLSLILPISNIFADAISVEVAKVIQAPVPKQIEALGSLVANQVATISSEVDGRVEKIYFKDGQQVAEGMPIIQLDDAKDKADYDSAIAALNVAKNHYSRAQLVFNEGAISKQDLEQLKADVESKSADVKTNLVSLNQKKLTAPFLGSLGAFKVHEGDFISKGDELVTIVNIDKLKVTYAIPEVLRPELKLGQQVEIKSHAYPKKTFYGTVTFISPSIDVATRSVQIQAQVNNDDNLLSPGMFVSIIQDISIEKTALIIPSQSLVADLQGYQVYKITNNTAELTRVEIGTQFNGKAQVTKGLKEGDIIVIAGQQKLEDGSKVSVVSEKD